MRATAAAGQDRAAGGGQLRQVPEEAVRSRSRACAVAPTRTSTLPGAAPSPRAWLRPVAGEIRARTWARAGRSRACAAALASTSTWPGAAPSPRTSTRRGQGGASGLQSYGSAERRSGGYGYMDQRSCGYGAAERRR